MQNIIYEDILTYISNKHIFTHQIWYMDSYYIYLKNKIEGYVWANLEELKEKYAIPTILQLFLENFEKRREAK